MTKYLGLFILLLLVGRPAAAAENCNFVGRGQAMDSFVTTVAQSCEAFTKLCLFSPQSRFCATLKATRPPSSAGIQEQLENEFLDSLQATSEDLFSSYKTYRAKLSVLDVESRNPYPKRRALITNIALFTTTEWIGRYGGVVAANSEASANAQIAGGFVGYLGVAVVGWFGERVGINAKSLLTNAPYISARFAAALPVIGGEIVIPSATSAAAGARVKNKMIKLPISPAHAIRFDDKSDLDYSSADMEESYAQKDSEIFRDIFSSTAAGGAQMAVGAWGIAATTTRYPWLVSRAIQFGAAGSRLALWTARASRFLRLTPVSFAVFFLAENAVGQIITDSRTVMAKFKFYRARNLQQANAALNALYFAKLGDAHNGKRVIEVYKALRSLGSLPVDNKNRAQLDFTRNNLLSHFRPENMPADTRADMINKYICRAKPIVLKGGWLESWTTYKGWTAASERNVFSEIIARDMSLKIRDYRNGLLVLEKSLKSIQSLNGWVGATNVQAQALQVRLDAITRALAEAQTIRQEIKGPIQFFPDNGAISAVWSVIGLPDQGKGRVKQYLGRIIAIEQKAQNPDFAYLYGCN